MTSATAAFRQALRHPGLLALLFIVRSLIALTAAWLLVDAFSPAWIMGLPRKDESVFEPGLALLLRLIRENHRQWSHGAAVGTWIAIASAVTGVVAVTFVLFSLGYDARQPARDNLNRTIKSIPRQLSIVSIYWAAVMLAVYTARRLSGVLPALVYPWVGEKGADVLLLFLVALLATVVVALRIACDLTRMLATRSSQDITIVGAAAMRGFRSRWRFWVGMYACFTIPSVAVPVVIETYIPTFSSTSHFGPWPTLVHQGVVLLTCLLQLCWWAVVQAQAGAPRTNI